MPIDIMDWIEKLLPGAGAALVAALILAPGGILVRHLESTNSLRPRHTADWSAYAAALGLSCNLLAALSFLAIRTLLPTRLTGLGLSTANYILLLIMVSGLLSFAARTALRGLRRRRSRADIAKARELLVGGPPLSSREGHLVFEYRSADEQARQLLLAAAQCAGEGWRVTIHHSGGKVTGVPYKVPEVLAFNPELDGLLLTLAGETPEADSRLFVRWPSIRAIEIFRVSEPSGDYLLKIWNSGVERTLRLGRVPGRKFHEAALNFQLSPGRTVCSISKEPTDGGAGEAMATFELFHDELRELEPGVPAILKGASTIEAVPERLEERISALQSTGRALQRTENHVTILIRRIADREIRVWAFVNQEGAHP